MNNYSNFNLNEALKAIFKKHLPDGIHKKVLRPALELENKGETGYQRMFNGGVKEGDGNNTLTGYVDKAQTSNIPPEEAAAIPKSPNQTPCVPPLEAGEADNITKSTHGYQNENQSKLIWLADYKPKEKKWLLEGAIAEGFPNLIYAEGGIGKSYLGLHLATLTALGDHSFLGLKFPADPINSLYVDWELDEDETGLRAGRIARGMGLDSVPRNLGYIRPEKSLYGFLPELQGIISKNDIKFVILDSLGAFSLDPEDVKGIVDVFTRLKNMRVTTLILDHQPKTQFKESYNTKTPYGSVYKFNLSRSVFQLSRVERGMDRITLKLTHKKSNFGGKLDDLIFDVSFESDRVMFSESRALSPEAKDMLSIWEAMEELQNKRENINQKNLIAQLKGVLGRDRVILLLEDGEGKYWDKKPGEKKEILYEPKTLKWKSRR